MRNAGQRPGCAGAGAGSSRAARGCVAAGTRTSVPVTSSASSTATPRHESCSWPPSVRVRSRSSRCRISSSPSRFASRHATCSPLCAPEYPRPPGRGWRGSGSSSSSSEWRADGGDGAVPQQRGAVGERHRRRPVHHHERGDAVEHPAQRGFDPRLGVHVERRQRVVEHDHVGAGEDGACQRDALALTARQRHALLADAGVEPPRQVVHELGLRDEQRVVDLVVGGVGVAEGDVLAHAGREQRRLLEADRDLRAQRPQRDVAHVDAVDGDAAVGDVVEARHQHGERRLARAGEPDQRERLARLDLEVDVVEHVGRSSRDSAKPTPSNRTRPVDLAELGDGGRAVMRRVLHGRVAVEHLEHALRGGRRLLGHAEDPARATRSARSPSAGS